MIPYDKPKEPQLEDRLRNALHNLHAWANEARMLRRAIIARDEAVRLRIDNLTLSLDNLQLNKYIQDRLEQDVQFTEPTPFPQTDEQRKPHE